MRNAEKEPTDILAKQLAERLKALRLEKGYSLEQLAQQSGVSRATLSRIENLEVSPTASVLGKICPVFRLTLSGLMLLVEGGFQPLVKPRDQFLWKDPAIGFERLMLSPPSAGLKGEVLECQLSPGEQIHYERSPRPGLEHHLLMLDGGLELMVANQSYRLEPGDCLRYLLNGASQFTSDPVRGARYLLFMV